MWQVMCRLCASRPWEQARKWAGRASSWSTCECQQLGCVKCTVYQPVAAAATAEAPLKSEHKRGSTYAEVHLLLVQPCSSAAA